MARLFLSHASADKTVVRRIAAALRAAGHDPWLDEDEILVGESIPAPVARGLRDADFVVLCLSKAAAERGWIEAERDAALMQQLGERKERILPVRLEDVSPLHLIAALKYVDLFPGEQAFANGIARLMSSIEAHGLRRDRSDAGVATNDVGRQMRSNETSAPASRISQSSCSSPILLPFVGRDKELTELETLLKTEPTMGSRVVFVQGLHGMGKTFMVQEYARRSNPEHGKIHYINFQQSLKGDGSFVDRFLPHQLLDEDFKTRLWKQLKELRRIPREDIVIFDEIENLLDYFDEYSLVRTLKAIQSLAPFVGRGIVIISRWRWDEREWEIVTASPMLFKLPTMELTPLGRLDCRALIERCLASSAKGMPERHVEALIPLSGGIPLLITQWAKLVGVMSLVETSSHNVYANWIHSVDWYFRGTWKGLSNRQRISLIAAIALRLGAEEDSFEIWNSTMLGATSAAFAWWLLHNREVVRHEIQCQHRLSDYDRGILRLLEELQNVENISILLEIWTDHRNTRRFNSYIPTAVRVD
jgi:hypothetical protein